MRVVALRGARVRPLGRAWAHRRRAALAWTATEAVRAFVLVSLSRRGDDRSAIPSRRLLVEEIGFGIRLWIGSLARFLNFRTDQILMGFLASEAALGFYAVAVNASEVLLYLPSSAATALLPLIARTEPVRRGEETLRAFRSVDLRQRGRRRRRRDPRAASCCRPSSATPSTSRSSPSSGSCRARSGFAASAVFSNALVGSSSPGLSSLGPIVSLAVGFALDLALIPHIRTRRGRRSRQRRVPGRRRRRARSRTAA